jgi:hypothetical protein
MPSLPVKDVALYDVSTILEKPMPASADSPIVLGVWSRNHDSMELRHLAGHWIDSLHSGEMRLSVSILVWSLLPTTKLKCGPRGPSGSKDSPIWYWFSLGAALLKAKSLHPGWLTFHDTTVDAMKTHYRHWSAAERLKILMFWTFPNTSLFTELAMYMSIILLSMFPGNVVIDGLTHTGLDASNI